MKSSVIKPAIIKKEFIHKFAKNKKLTDFQKSLLMGLINSIWLDYEIGLRYSEYIEKSRLSIEDFIFDLDSESKNEVKTILDYVKIMKTYTLKEVVNYFMSKGEKILEHLNDQEYIKNKYKMDLYEESIFKYKHGLIFIPQDIIKSIENKDFLDCGGYIGGSALIFEREYKPHKVYSFEPDPANYEVLLKNIKSYNLTKVIPIYKGVGEKSGITKFTFQGALSRVSNDGNEEIEIITIDEFVQENNLSVGLIKIDVEGTELKVLEGAIKTIRESKPILLVGIYHNPEEFFKTKDYLKSLMLDYKIKIKRLCDFRALAEIHLIAW